MAFSTVYGPMIQGPSAFGVKKVPIGSSGNGNITASVLKTNVPGMDIRQTTSVNGVSVDVGSSTKKIDTGIRTIAIKK